MFETIKLLIAIFLPMFFLSIVFAIIRKLWFMFRWWMGWRPNILDQSLVNECVELCSKSVLENTARHIEANHDYTMTELDREEYLEDTTKVFRAVIEDYIHRFSLKRA